MKNALQIPLAFPRQSQVPVAGIKVLGADVGGTKTNLALFHADDEKIEQVKAMTYKSADFHSFNEIVHKFLAENKLPVPDRICAGVAGPIFHGKVKITNLAEEMDAEDIRKQTGAKEVALLNDLETTAYGLAALGNEDIITLYPGNPSIKGNMAIIAPGTGLGEAGLYWDGESYYPFPTEGGHCDFCPRTELDIELYKFLQNKYGIVSWERLVAGPGIHDIYLFLRSSQNKPEPETLTKALAEKDPSAVISSAAINGTDEICMQAMDNFVRYLARESSNLILKMKATGGLFLGGGIPPKIVPLLQKEIFLKHYFDCDRMKDLLETVPVKIITKDTTALLGAAYFGAYGKEI